MRRDRQLVYVLAIAATCAGCKPNIDEEARKLVVPMAWPSAVMAVMTGTGEQLVESGRINLHKRVKAEDDVEIDAWVITSRSCPAPTRLVRGTVVLLPPLLTCKSWFLDLAGMLADRGWDVVLIDHRAHGWSGGRYVTWGAKEKHDVKAVMDALIAENAVNHSIYAVGASMGGAVAIQYAAIEPRCQGVMAIAPPAGARQIGRRILALLAEKDFEAALKRAGEMADFDPADADTVAAAGRLKCPLLLIHGLLDSVVPYGHGRAVFAAAPQPKKFVPQLLHGHSIEAGRNEWVLEQIETLHDLAQKRPSRLDSTAAD